MATSDHGPADAGYREDEDYTDEELIDPDTIPVEALVDHLLAAKRSLAAVNLTRQAESHTIQARQLHEEAVLLDAKTSFLQRGILYQLALLKRVQHGMVRTYEASRKEVFDHLIPSMDRTSSALVATMEKLKTIAVDPVFRPPREEEPKYLFDFVSEDQVNAMVADMKDGLHQLDAARTLFAQDLGHFETEMRELADALANVSLSPTAHPAKDAIVELFASMRHQIFNMATNLTSLIVHFDTCCHAVQLTEGGTDMALRKAQSETNPVSISGVMDVDQDELEALSKAHVITRVLLDAHMVDETVADLQHGLQDVELKFHLLKDQSDKVKAAYEAVTHAFRLLEAMARKLEGYMDAETRFVEHCHEEKQVILDTMSEMERLRDHWERYMEGYDSLLFEVERRRAVEDKIRTIWHKAKEQVDKLAEKDRADREAFTDKVGEFLPVDLWIRKSGPLQRWEVVRAQREEGPGKGASGEMPQQEDDSAAVLSPGAVHGALERTGMAGHDK